MIQYKNFFCFNHNSSTPLEHTFGRTRVRSKDVNTLSRFVKSLSDLENYSLKFAETKSSEKIHCWISSFGVNVSEVKDDLIDVYSVNDFEAKDIALVILSQAGFLVTHETKPNCLNWFYKVITLIKNDFESQNSNKSVSSNSLTLGTRRNARSKSLITCQPNFIPPLLISGKNDVQEDPLNNTKNSCKNILLVR